jgi:predicted NAD-dependent protein-ADP-ribosyltransferase YbiA (DUF1768 family)
MDIKSGCGYPASALSNFAPHPFVIDGIECASMEGFLQSLKFNKPHIQEEVCKLVGFGAKRRGQEKNSQWQAAQTLWWKGVAIKRDSDEYQDLLTRAFDALSTNDGFKRAILATRDAVLSHSIGKSKESETVLTEREFCSQLHRVRARLQAEQNKRPRFF